MKECKKCLLPENFPKANIDENDLCVYCRKGMTLKDYSHEEPSFLEFVKKIKKNNKYNYDCLVCYSGGKDSTYTLIQAKEKYGLNPLAFTLDNGFISQKAKENIEMMCDSLGVDLITVKPKSKQMNRVFKTVLTQRVFAENVMSRLSAACHACITFVNYKAIQIALEKDIKIIISGFTHGQVPKAMWPHNPDMLLKTFDEMKKQLTNKTGFDVGELYPKIDFSKLRNDHILYNVNPLLFERYDEKKIIGSIKKYGWERPQDVDSCSSNCLMNKVGNHYHFKLYNYHPYQYEVSSLIRIEAITKDEGRKMLADTLMDKGAKKIVKEVGM